MTKKLIFQINVPNYNGRVKLTAYTFVKDMYEISQRNAKRYADKTGADYYVLTDPKDFKPAENKHLDYQKLKMYDFLDYDNIVYLDSDYIIKDNAPNLFELCGDNFAASIDSGKGVDELAQELNMPRNRYFNAGFMYLNKTTLLNTKDFISEYLKTDYRFDGQGLLNKMFYDRGISFLELPSADWNPVDKTFGTYADHYAGTRKKLWGKVCY